MCVKNGQSHSIQQLADLSASTASGWNAVQQGQLLQLVAVQFCAALVLLADNRGAVARFRPRGALHFPKLNLCIVRVAFFDDCIEN